MTEQERNERIQRSRELLRWSGEYYESDQKLLRKQPPLVKEADGGKVLALPKNFEDLPMEHDFVKVKL